MAVWNGYNLQIKIMVGEKVDFNQTVNNETASIK